MAKAEPNRQQLDRAAWIKAAFDVLADKGLDGIRVEVLAKRLKVTKGSFYWHFKDRRDLLDAVLETWKDGRIRDIQKQTRAVPGEELPRAYHVIEEDSLLKEITDRYNEQLSPYYAAARLWVDGVIDPLETRKIISMGIEAANHAPIEKFNVGVIQT